MNHFLRATLVIVAVTCLFIPMVSADTTYTVNQAGGANFTDLNACLAAIDAGSPEMVYTVQFTDASAVTYTLSPAERTLRDGIQITLTAATAGIVTIDGRLNVAQAGGTFTANNIHFRATGQWALIHGYDGQYYRNCTFGPATDNGVIVRSGANNLFQDCTFVDITNSSVYVSGGSGEFNNCTWTNVGRALVGQNAWNNTGHYTVNGGSQTGNHTQMAFVLSGYYITVNDFTATGVRTAVTRDWEDGPGTIEFNRCQFLGIRDRAVTSYINNSNVTTITLNHCLIESDPLATADLVVMDGRGNGDNATINLDSCIIRYRNTTGATAINCWSGGTINVINTVIDGANNSLLCTSENSGYKAELNVIHCVIVNNIAQAAAVGTGANTHIKILNTVIDASNAGGMNIPSEATKEVAYNLVNVSGSYNGDPYYTGDPRFVNAASGDYHILDDSACTGKGIMTYVTWDVDGDTRPWGGTRPDIGIDEIAVSVRNWDEY